MYEYGDKQKSIADQEVKYQQAIVSIFIRLRECSFVFWSPTRLSSAYEIAQCLLTPHFFEQKEDRSIIFSDIKKSSIGFTAHVFNTLQC